MSLVVSDVARSYRSVRLRGRSYVARAADRGLAFQIRPLDQNSGGCLVGRPVARDLPGVTLSNAGIAHFIPDLSERNVRMMRLQSAEPTRLSPGTPPVFVADAPLEYRVDRPRLK